MPQRQFRKEHEWSAEDNVLLRKEFTFRTLKDIGEMLCPSNPVHSLSISKQAMHLGLIAKRAYRKKEKPAVLVLPQSDALLLEGLNESDKNEVSALAICFRALALLNKNQQMTVLRYLCQKCGVDWIRGLVDIPLEDPPQGKGKLR